MNATYRKQASAAIAEGVRLDAAMTPPVPLGHGEDWRERSRDGIHRRSRSAYA